MAISYLLTGASKNDRLKFAREMAQSQSSKFDTKEVNTAEERGIEAAKTIIQSSASQPFQGHLSSIIVAEANNLTPEAQNALLKTLEEPPEKTQIILTAPNSDSLLPTVVSRCQEIRLESSGEPEEKPRAKFSSQTSLSQKLQQLEKTGLEAQITVWEKQLRQTVLEQAGNSTQLQKLHRYNKTLLKLKKAEKLSVNKKLLTLIAALEEPEI